MKANSLVAAALLTLSTATATFAAPPAATTPFPIAYDATYNIVDNKLGNMQQRFLSNGTGRTRKEVTIKGNKTTVIVDYPTKTAWTIMETQKIVAKGPWRGDKDNDGGVEFVDLGEKMVDGHKCKGGSYVIKGGTKIQWNDKQYKVMVQTLIKGGGTERQTDMTAFTPGAPDASLFQPPTDGYTLVAKP